MSDSFPHRAYVASKHVLAELLARHFCPEEVIALAYGAHFPGAAVRFVPSLHLTAARIISSSPHRLRAFQIALSRRAGSRRAG